MSILSKIRENVGIVIAVIAISLGSFIFVDFFKGGNGPQDEFAGEVGGVKIDRRLFDAKYEIYEFNRGPAADSKTRYEYQNSAWNEVVQEAVYAKEYENLGLKLPDDELGYMYYGPFIHRLVQQQRFFYDSLGQFSPQRVKAVRDYFTGINMETGVDVNGNRINQQVLDQRTYLLNFENALKQTRMQEKYWGMLRGAMMVSANEATQDFLKSNRSVDVTYINIPYTSITEAIEPSDADYKEYFDKNKAKFERIQKEIVLQYCYFPVKPSRRDSAMTKENVARLGEDMKSAKIADLISLALGNSDVNSDTNFLPITELNAALAEVAATGDTTKVVGPVLNENRYSCFRLAAVKEDTNSFVKARHLLIKFEGDTAAAKSKAQGLASRANAENFAQLVSENSQDFLTQGSGGDLGWLSQAKGTERGKEFDDAVFAANTGQVVTAKSAEGFHVVLIQEKTNRTFRVAETNRVISASSYTNDSIYKRASQFATDISGNNALDSAIRKYPEASLQTSPPIQNGQTNLFGLEGARPIINWGFSASKDEVSEEIMDADNAFVIAKVLATGEKGTRALDEVKQQIKPEVINMVKARQIIKKVNEIGTADLDKLVSQYGVGAVKSNAKGLKMANPTDQVLASEKYVIGRAHGLQANQTSGPIQGNSGVFVVRTDLVNEPTVEQTSIAFSKLQLASSKKQAILNNTYNGLLDLGDVKDFRYKFLVQ